MNILERIQEIVLGGYEKAKDENSMRILARFTRGNVSTQNGFVIDEAALSRIQKKSDKSFANIKRMISQ